MIKQEACQVLKSLIGEGRAGPMPFSAPLVSSIVGISIPFIVNGLLPMTPSFQLFSY
jgi:hypothetical protein